MELLMDFPNYFNTLITIVTYNPKDDFGGKILRYIRIVDKIVSGTMTLIQETI